ncbi:alpha,alpha-trehalase [Dictyocaulus viviparus]|uniref:Trehalase n=1 Tax=Dictyocaulus viviparus TaxID=29172 RepID=A0A0D8Y1A3_DICVI|nr:alpha,alpha-trehalase [Dictyocaulus viviparus]
MANKLGILSTVKHDFVDIVYSPLQVNCTEPICEGEIAPIYCYGDILTNAWRLGLQDSCPGSKMRFTANEIMKNFSKLKYPISKIDFQAFCSENFDNVPYLKNVSLPDFKTWPTFFSFIRDKNHLKLAKLLHVLWSKLSRKFTDDVHHNASFYPIVPVNNSFIVPGGKFQIFFYWDSYWILKGLLLSEMLQTAEGMLQNFADIISKHGFIPNSGSVQLSRRTQPPLFIQMVKDYFTLTKHKESLLRWIPAMDTEMQFWLNKRRVFIKLPSKKRASVFVYKTETNCPRPESFLADFYLGMNNTDQMSSWKALASACESGWDFSSRWFDHEGMRKYEKVTIRTHTVVPVDLNVFMALNMNFLAESHSLLGNKSMFVRYRKMYDRLLSDIDTLFWNRSEGSWFDYDMFNEKQRTDFYPSNVFPLLLAESKSYASDVHSYLERINVYRYPGGIPSTFPVRSYEQWDFPNVWAPTQHLFIESLLRSQHPALRQRALDEANKFINTVFNGQFNPKEGMPPAVWEKYDARSSDGKPGGGGEYVVQEGFGWTNGVVMDLINLISREELLESEGILFLTTCEGILAIFIFVVAILLFAWCMVRDQHLWWITKNAKLAEEPYTRPLLEDSDNSD